VVDAGAARHAAISQLCSAAQASGSDFAHGWTQEPGGRVRAFSTPRAELLALAARQIGPLVVERRWTEHPRMEGLLRRSGGNEAHSNGAWLLALALLGAGASGTVVPDVITPEPGTDSTHADRAAALEAELARIRSSRGWRALERVYDALHILRGRGLRRR
jgi:hypothetical protein